MKLLTKNTDYAIRALLHLAGKPEEFVSSSVIARSENIPDRFLKQILQRLIKERLLVSKEGIAGGVRLFRDPGAIGLVDLIVMFQGPFELSSCMFRQKLCPNRAGCVIRSRIKSIEEMVLFELQSVSIRDLQEDMASPTRAGAGKKGKDTA